MNQCVRAIRWSSCLMVLACLVSVVVAAPAAKPAQPTKVYVPYEKLRGILEKEKQGVFLPCVDFQRLWQAAKGSPAGVTKDVTKPGVYAGMPLQPMADYTRNMAAARKLNEMRQQLRKLEAEVEKLSKE